VLEAILGGDEDGKMRTLGRDCFGRGNLEEEVVDF
jgi:hypothetical protein